MGMPVEISGGNGRICPDCNHAGGHHLVGIGCTVVVSWERQSDDPGTFSAPLFEASGVTLDGEPVIPVLCPCMTGYDEGGR
jgi:hypothetical protein